MKRLFLASCILLFASSAFSQSKKVVKLRVMPPLEQTEQTLVYPNPAEDVVNVPLSSESKKSTLLILNSEGKLLDKKTIEENTSSYALPFSDYAPGSYFITVISEGRTITYTVIKK